MKYLVTFVCGEEHHVLNYYDDDMDGVLKFMELHFIQKRLKLMKIKH